MSKKLKNYSVNERVNWALTCTNKMSVPYYTYKKEDGVYIPSKTFSLSYPINGVISFNNHMHKLVKLTPIAHHFLLYLSQIMGSETNEFHNDASTRMHFIELMKKNCGKDYTDNTVYRSLTLLKKEGYIIKRNMAKRHIINPLYFYRGRMKEREKLFRELLSEAMNPIKGNKDIKEKIVKIKNNS
jgi:hypothetical protein